MLRINKVTGEGGKIELGGSVIYIDMGVHLVHDFLGMIVEVVVPWAV